MTDHRPQFQSHAGHSCDEDGNEGLAESLLQNYLSILTPSSPLVMVGLGRVELPTSPLSGVRSNQLSYRPGRMSLLVVNFYESKGHNLRSLKTK
jgi:hypothetical protein